MRCRPSRSASSSRRTGWIAQRYGVLAFFGDRKRVGGRVDIDGYAVDLVEELISDSRALGCEAEIRHALTVIGCHRHGRAG